MLNKKVVAQKSETEKRFFSSSKQIEISKKKVTEIAENGCPVQLPCID